MFFVEESFLFMVLIEIIERDPTLRRRKNLFIIYNMLHTYIYI